jgi:hypothetical protein
MQLIEKKNNDMTALIGLTGMSLISQFARQTVMVRNDAYDCGKRYCHGVDDAIKACGAGHGGQ